jgi:cell wall-associated NlpC family hydrolase
MRQTDRLLICLFSFIILLTTAPSPANAKPKNRSTSRFAARAKDTSSSFSPDIESISRSRSRYARQNKEIEALLYSAIIDRIGLPYRFSGTDDRGYDCSGFVWRVFNEAGAPFRRESARSLWKTLPEATESEERQFGTLVFFKGLNHVGIVRDAYTFYHVSSSRGVVRSFFTDYWGGRIIGYRRVPLPASMVKIKR